MYLRIINDTINYPYTINELRDSYPNTSLPFELTDASLVEWDMYVVIPTPMPNDYTKNITEGTPQLIDGVYTQIWNQSDATQEEIDVKIQNQWEQIRVARNEILTQCDWTVLADSPVSASIEEWKTYRQQLRDITTTYQSVSDDGFTWPTEPS
mgnify:CR=1 FL=1